MKVIDISWPLTEKMSGYKNKQTVSIEHAKTFQEHNVRESTIRINAHAGTHIDAPSHFIDTGKTSDAIALTQLIGPAQVLDLTHCSEKITAQDLMGYDIMPDDIILLKTQNSFLRADAPFDAEFVYLDMQAAAYLAQKKIKAVGIDYLGIERAQPEHETHITLMEHGIVIIEGLRLYHVTPGTYFFICLPLALSLEAAPARAILCDGISTV